MVDDLDVRVVTVGGGPVGLAAILLPANVGIRSTVLERNQSISARWRSCARSASTAPYELDAVDDGVTLTVETAEGEREMRAAYAIAADGAASTLRSLSGIEMDGAPAARHRQPEGPSRRSRT